ncbi:hypothetical protein ABMY20_00915 [Tenacibaculum sp. SSH1-16]|uniref:hypothetical protein n=1 Tax=Tenacibaculum sp. SSH1-16 TaxID=3136667 RepID=UPI0032C46DCF
MSKYNSSNIKIGDKVYFEREGINNYNLYWTVLGFLDNMIEIEIDEMEYNDKIYIDFSDITQTS